MIRETSADDMNGLIDFHCHLDDEDFALDRHEIIARCAAAGYERLVVVADPYNPDSIATTLALLERYDLVLGMCAAHPHAAKDYDAGVEERIRRLLANEKCIAVGEAGLDYHYDLSPRDVQRRVFARQIELAVQHARPLVIHSRQAEDDVLALLDEQNFSGPVVFHCYTGSAGHARRILDRGGYLSFSGIITFPKAEELRELLADTPLERLFVETDAPYLAPVPLRGQRNSPEFLPHTLQKAAEVKGLGQAALIEQIRRNFQAVFAG